MRGAGGSDKASSARWLPSVTPSRGSAAGSERSNKALSVQWLPPATPSRGSSAQGSQPARHAKSATKDKHVAGSVVGDSFWLPADTPGRALSSEVRSVRSKRKVEDMLECDDEVQTVEPCSWTCQICHLRIEAATKPSLTQKRADHIKYRHKGRNFEAGEIR